jgi:hypothetical protein
MKHPLRRFASSPSPAGGERILWTGGAGSTVALAEDTRAGRPSAHRQKTR